MNSQSTLQYNNFFDSKESYLAFRKEWRAYQKSLLTSVRAAKAALKEANRTLNTAQIEMKARTPYQLYFDLANLQSERLAARKQITVASDIFALVRNKPTRIQMDSYAANPKLIPSVLDALIKDGVFSDSSAISSAINLALLAKDADKMANAMEKCRP